MNYKHKNYSYSEEEYKELRKKAKELQKWGEDNYNDNKNTIQNSNN